MNVTLTGIVCGKRFPVWREQNGGLIVALTGQKRRSVTSRLVARLPDDGQVFLANRFPLLLVVGSPLLPAI